MSNDIVLGEPQDRLKFRLLPNEQRGFIERLGSRVIFSRLPARSASEGTVVLFHGVGSNASRWEEFVERTPLQEHWDIVRVDLRGHGSSETRVSATLEVHVGDAIAILDQLGVKRAVIMGHSLGAHIALKLAQSHPERVQALVLVDPLINMALTEEAVKKRRWCPVLRMVHCLARTANAMGIRRRMPHYSLRAHDQKAREMLARGGEALKEFIREYSSPFKDLGHIHVADYTRDLLEISRISPCIDGFEAPVLVIGSSAGKITSPLRVHEWVQTLPKGEMDVVECVHWPFTECPEKISEVVEEWISAQRA